MLAALAALTLSLSPASSGSYATLSSGVKMYFEKHGNDGPPILLLHGGTGSLQNWAKVVPLMSASRVLYVPEFQGHGHTADVDRPISYDGLAEDVAELLQQLKLEQVDVAGFSDGGIVALILAEKHPKLVHKVLATGARWQEASSIDAGALKWFTGVKPEDWDAAFKAEWAAGNPDPDHWPVFFGKMKKMWLSLNRPFKELERIHAPVMLMAGDTDMVKLDHTVAMRSHLENGELCILPGTGHGTPELRPEWFASIALDFFATAVPVEPPAPDAGTGAKVPAPRPAQAPPPK